MAAVASKQLEVAATAVAFAPRVTAVLVKLILLGARWRPFMRCDTLDLERTP